MNIYEKLAQVRDIVSLEEDAILWENRAYALGQICDQAFTNESAPDQIPSVLYFEDCALTEQELALLLANLGLKIETIVVENYSDISNLKDFEVFLCC